MQRWKKREKVDGSAHLLDAAIPSRLYFYFLLEFSPRLISSSLQAE